MPQPAYTESMSALALSAEDVSRLLKDTSPDTRIDMTGRIGNAYNAAGLTPQEILIAEQIFRLLLRDTELKVRATLAEYVKDSPAIPRDIVLKLARDVEEVALPVLQFSEVLSDDDLIELIRATQDQPRFLAISKRRSVSDSVTGTLIEKGDETVAASLVENTGAMLTPETVDRLIAAYAQDEKLLEAISNRPQLPAASVEKLVSIVSSGLAETLKQKYQLPGGQIDREVEKTREKETLSLIRKARDDEDIDRLIVQLQATGKLTPSMILSALCQGSFDFFETALAKLSGIPVANARKLITDRGDLGFRAIYNKSGLPDAMFPAVKLLLKIVRDLDEAGENPGSPRYANRIVERILQYSEDTQMENLSYIIALVRRVAQ